jgi:hypothetical protein
MIKFWHNIEVHVDIESKSTKCFGENIEKIIALAPMYKGRHDKCGPHLNTVFNRVPCLAFQSTRKSNSRTGLTATPPTPARPPTMDPSTACPTTSTNRRDCSTLEKGGPVRQKFTSVFWAALDCSTFEKAGPILQILGTVDKNLQTFFVGLLNVWKSGANSSDLWNGR